MLQLYQTLLARWKEEVMVMPWHLMEADFFQDLPGEKQDFMSLSVRRDMKKNDFLFSEEEPGNSVFYLEKGSVKISRLTFLGKEPIISVRKAGELFGLAEVIEGKKRKCNAQAISAGIVFEMDKDNFELLLSRHYRVARRVIEILGRRIRFLGEQIGNLMVCDVTTRLLKLLIYLCHQRLVDLDSGRGPITVPIDLTQEQMAACTGSCQQTISETLKQLQEDGLIHVSRKQITLLKPLDIMARIQD